MVCPGKSLLKKKNTTGKLENVEHHNLTTKLRLLLDFFLFSLIFDCFYDCSLFETIQAFALGILIIAIHRFIQYSKTRTGIFLNRQL